MASPAATTQPIRRLSIASNVVLQLVAAVLLLVILNYFSFRHYLRWDLTRNQQFTLSDQTVSYLKSLRGKTDIVAAFPRGSLEEREIRALLDEYRRSAKSHVAIDYVDLAREPSRKLEAEKQFNVVLNQNGIVVSKDPTSKAKATETGSPPAPVRPRRTRFLSQDQLFSYDERSKPPRLAEFRGEDLVTSALISVNQKASPTVYFLTSNIGDLPKAMAADGKPRTARNVLEDIGIKQDVRIIDLSLIGQAEIPADAGALISLRAGLNFTEREISLVRDYWEQKKGAGLMFLIDPDAELSRLDAFLTENGVKPRADRVLKVVTTARGPRKEFQIEAAFNPNSPITAKFGGRTLSLGDQSKSLKLEEEPNRLRAANLEVTPLILARGDYWGETKYFEDEPKRDAADVGDPELVVLAASAEKGAQRDQRLGAYSSRMVVVGNAGLIDPDRQTGGVNPTAYDFVSSSLNWVLNREELIGISAKRMEAYHIAIGPTATAKILWLCLGLLPGAVLMFALFMWSVRRA
jgi:gliding motility-associatede transport system auxiliary component